MELHRPDGSISGYCFTTLVVCEAGRKDIIEQKLGKPTPCAPQRMAHCVQVIFPYSVSWQVRCARTDENCEARREFLAKEKRDSKQEREVGACQPSLNINPLVFMKAPSALEEP